MYRDKIGTVEHLQNSEAVTIHGAAALPLQMLHPLVAEGVLSTGGMVNDPVGRLRHTLESTAAIFAGNTEIIDRFSKVHNRISGTLPQDAGIWKADTAFKASDPELLLWVFATLIGTRICAYEEVYGSLSPDVKEEFYDNQLPIGKRFGVTQEVLPKDYTAFQDYYSGMVASVNKPTDRLAVTQAALTISEALLSAQVPGIPVPIRPFAKIASAALMPSAARAAYGLEWNRPQRATWHIGKKALRLLDR